MNSPGPEEKGGGELVAVCVRLNNPVVHFFLSVSPLLFLHSSLAPSAASTKIVLR